MALIYIGSGSLHGIPARNLTDKEVEKFGEKYLLKTGLYKKPEKAKVIEETTEEGQIWQDQEH